MPRVMYSRLTTRTSASAVGFGLSGVPTIRRILSLRQRPLRACLRIVFADEVLAFELADADVYNCLPSVPPNFWKGVLPKSATSPEYSRPYSESCAVLPELFTWNRVSSHTVCRTAQARVGWLGPNCRCSPDRDSQASEETRHFLDPIAAMASNKTARSSVLNARF